MRISKALFRAELPERRDRVDIFRCDTEARDFNEKQGPGMAQELPFPGLDR